MWKFNARKGEGSGDIPRWPLSLLLVGETTGGGFETLGRDKTHCFISRTKSLQQLEKLTIHTLSFSLFF